MFNETQVLFVSDYSIKDSCPGCVLFPKNKPEHIVDTVNQEAYHYREAMDHLKYYIDSSDTEYMQFFLIHGLLEGWKETEELYLFMKKYVNNYKSIFNELQKRHREYMVAENLWKTKRIICGDRKCSQKIDYKYADSILKDKTLEKARNRQYSYIKYIWIEMLRGIRKQKKFAYCIKIYNNQPLANCKSIWENVDHLACYAGGKL